MRLGICLIAAAALLPSCTTATPTPESTGPESTGEAEQAIVRGQAEAGRPYAVMIHEERVGHLHTYCSGTLIAPRVVLTAAHCIKGDRLHNGTFVYWGGDYAADLSLLAPNPAGASIAPPPSATSVWAVAEAITVYPTYDASQNHPDLAVIYLDRAASFDPLPLHRKRLGDHWNNRTGTIVGWGGDKADTADISQVEGSGIKRSGQAVIEGSPTAADYHTDDPNPGLLDPAIRADLLKLDGSAPHANICAGDSGGPLIVQRRDGVGLNADDLDDVDDDGRGKLAGVIMWTGLWCEDYSIVTRIDPFLPFLDSSIQLGGRMPVVPELDCVQAQSDGTFAAFFGYTNGNAVSMTIPYGPGNEFKLDRTGARPTVFEAGSYPYSFRVPFTAADKLVYKLNPPGPSHTTLKVDSNSLACAAGDVNVSCWDACTTEMAAVCDPPADKGTFADCMSMCIQSASPCLPEYAAYNECVAKLDPTDSSIWECDGGIPPFPWACLDELNAAWSCGL